MIRPRSVTSRAVATTLVMATFLPVPGFGTPLSLGTVRVMRGVQVSSDGGKTWLAASMAPTPLADGTWIRATTGGALLELTDGSRVSVMPFSEASIEREAHGTAIALHRGRLSLRLPARARLAIEAGDAHVRPAGDEAVTGEVLVTGDRTVGVRASRGRLEIQETAVPRRTMFASLEPVFVPKRPERRGPLFVTDAPATPPPGARAAFGPGGDSAGYVSDGQFIVHPGFSSGLTRPFPSSTVQLAMAKIPEPDRPGATPLFDVNGGYLGYESGAVFYAQAQLTPARVAQAGAPGGGAAGGSGTILGVSPAVLAIIASGLVLGGVVGVSAAGASGAFDGPATPFRPGR